MSRLRIVRGNTFFTRSEVEARTYAGELIEDFDLEQATGIKIVARAGYKAIDMTDFSISGNYLSIKWKGLPCGHYGLDVSGLWNGIEWRFFNDDVLSIVESSDKANIPPDCIIRDDYYIIDAATFIAPELIGGGGSEIWFGTQAQYDALSAAKKSVITAFIYEEEEDEE